MKADLHMHSSFSDGVMSPEKLAVLCAERGITVMALTDHDSFDGSNLLRELALPVTLIPGVELSIDSGLRGLHLLGYGYAEGKELRDTVRTLAAHRRERAKTMLCKLADLGMPLDEAILSVSANGSIGRPHIARALVEAGYTSNIQEAFDRYLGEGKPAYEAGERLTMEDAIALLRRNHFMPVLAHPCELKLTDQQLIVLLTAWKNAGLMGLEVYHPSARSRGFHWLDSIARSLGLYVTGGSDFHLLSDGNQKKHGEPGCTAADWQQSARDIDDLLAQLKAMAAEEMM